MIDDDDDDVGANDTRDVIARTHGDAPRTTFATSSLCGVIATATGAIDGVSARASARRSARARARATTATRASRDSVERRSTSLATFASEAKQTFVRTKGACAVVIGNEGCDLDSVACAVAFAYATAERDGAPRVPIASARRSELALRPDVVLALFNVGLGVEDLVCLEEVEEARASAPEARPTSAALVDHNVNNERLFPGWGDVVTSVIDHHDDEGAHAGCARVIEPCGSCASLVRREAAAGSSGGAEREVARLLLGAILLDTRCLDASTTRALPVDFASAEVLRGVLGWDEAAARAEYEALAAARHDQSSFTCAQLLAKDYKQWTMGAYEIGVASFSVRFQDLMSRQGASSIDAECEAFIKTKGVDALFMMTSFEDQDAGGAYTRQIAVSARDATRVDVLDVMRRVGASTPLAPLAATLSAPRAFLAAYVMGDVKASRKKVQPILADVFVAMSEP